MIRTYIDEDAKALFDLLEREGDEWNCYWGGKTNRSQYRKALQNSIVYVLFEGDQLCGYARCREDDGFGIYVYDLLVDKAHRGKNYGKMLMEQMASDYSDQEAYVLSGVDAYYEKLNYLKEGSIFIIPVRGATD